MSEYIYAYVQPYSHANALTESHSYSYPGNGENIHSHRGDSGRLAALRNGGEVCGSAIQSASVASCIWVVSPSRTRSRLGESPDGRECRSHCDCQALLYNRKPRPRHPRRRRPPSSSSPRNRYRFPLDCERPNTHFAHVSLGIVWAD